MKQITKNTFIIWLLILLFTFPNFFNNINKYYYSIYLIIINILVKLFLSLFISNGLVNLLTIMFFYNYDNGKEILKTQKNNQLLPFLILAILAYLNAIKSCSLLIQNIYLLITALYLNFKCYYLIILGNQYFIHKFKILKLDQIKTYEIVSKGVFLNLKTIKLNLRGNKKFIIHRYLTQMEIKKLILHLNKYNIKNKN